EQQLPGRLADWEKSAAAKPEALPWVILDPVRFKAESGATFTRQEDGSLLAGGKKGNTDVYTLVVATDLTGITPVRLEALADPSLVQGGPGRADNGNFALTDFRLTAHPAANGGRESSGDNPVPVRLRNPRATFEQKGLPIAAALDDDDKSGWAIDPQF